MSLPFKVGDKVKWLNNYIGIIRYVDPSNSDACYAIEFGPGFNGHSCMGHVKSRNGWWLSDEPNLVLLEPVDKRTKEQLIIDKIKYLDNKFAQRNKNHDNQASPV